MTDKDIISGEMKSFYLPYKYGRTVISDNYDLKPHFLIII